MQNILLAEVLKSTIKLNIIYLKELAEGWRKMLPARNMVETKKEVKLLIK